MPNKRILELFFEKKLDVPKIADLMNISKQNIYKQIKNDRRYDKELNERIKMRELKKENQINDILSLFYAGKKPSEIAKQLHVSNSTVTRAIQSSENYTNEKEKRKNENSIRNKVATKQLMEQRRQEVKLKRLEETRIVAGMIRCQALNAISMSRKRKVNSKGIVEINLNHYNFNSSKGRLEFDETCGKRPSDLPKYYSVHKVSAFTKLYDESFERGI